MQGHFHHPQADQHALGFDRDRGTKEQGVAIDRLANKMVLGNPDGVEAELFDEFGFV